MHLTLVLTLPLFGLVACADSVGYPSLAKRPFENGSAPPPVATPAPPPSDAALRQRIMQRVSEAEGSIASFELAFGRARSAVSASGASGTESWISAQLELSRLEATLAPAREALAALDDERRLLMNAGNPDDRTALEAGLATVEAIEARLSAQAATLSAQLSAR